MKRAKITLVAIALLAIAGGTLAAAAKRATDRIYVTTTAGGNATITLSSVTLIGAPGQQPLGFTYATTVFNGVASTVLVPYYAGL